MAHPDEKTRAMSLQIPLINGIRMPKALIGLAFVLISFGFCHPAKAAEGALDVTIHVVGPGQDIQGVIDHEIALPQGHQVAGALLHEDHARNGVEARSDAKRELSDLTQQELNDSQESGSMEEQTQELMDQAQQTDQTVQDQEQETD